MRWGATAKHRTIARSRIGMEGAMEMTIEVTVGHVDKMNASLGEMNAPWSTLSRRPTRKSPNSNKSC